MSETPKRNPGGRPRKSPEHKKDYSITISLTKSQYSSVLEKFKNSSLSIAENCAKLVVGGEVREALSSEEKTMLRQLVGMANNINRITYLANTHGIESVSNTSEKLYEEIYNFITSIRHDR